MYLRLPGSRDKDPHDRLEQLPELRFCFKGLKPARRAIPRAETQKESTVK